MRKNNLLNNQRGQSLIEYLVIVAFVGIASIGLVQLLGQNISISLANISNALGSNGPSESYKKADGFTNKKDFTNFMNTEKNNK